MNRFPEQNSYDSTRRSLCTAPWTKAVAQMTHVAPKEWMPIPGILAFIDAFVEAQTGANESTRTQHSKTALACLCTDMHKYA